MHPLPSRLHTWPEDMDDIADDFDEVARLRKEADHTRQTALKFFNGPGPEKLFATHAVLVGELQLMSSVLKSNEPAWEVRELASSLDHGHRSYPLLEIHKGTEAGGRVVRFMNRCRSTLLDTSLWKECPQNEFFASYLHKVAARAAAAAYELVLLPSTAWPMKLFSLLKDPHRRVAEQLINEARARPCILDPWSEHFLSTHNSADLLLAEPAQMTLATVAGMSVGNTFDVEREHTRNVRRSQHRLTHSMCLGDVALWRMGSAAPAWYEKVGGGWDGFRRSVRVRHKIKPRLAGTDESWKHILQLRWGKGSLLPECVASDPPHPLAHRAFSPQFWVSQNSSSR